MTENKKRYVYHQSRDFGSLIEDTKDNKCLHFMSQATEELNALHEQNQNLKFLNNKYAKENKSLKVIRNSLKGIKKHIDLLSDDGVI